MDLFKAFIYVSLKYKQYEPSILANIENLKDLFAKDLLYPCNMHTGFYFVYITGFIQMRQSGN